VVCGFSDDEPQTAEAAVCATGMGFSGHSALPESIGRRNGLVFEKNRSPVPDGSGGAERPEEVTSDE